MDFLKRPLAITDIETSGLDAHIHEILEIGVIIVDQKRLTVKDEWHTRIKPRNLLAASKKSLEISGYHYKDWLYAPELRDAIKIYAKKTKHAVFTAHNT